MSSTNDTNAFDALAQSVPSTNATTPRTYDTSVPSVMLQGSSQFHCGLEAMEDSLSCVVCREIFRNPISLYPCQHSFCSECVRKSLKEQLKSLKRTANCPVCRVQLDTSGIAFEKCIRPNPTLEDLSNAYSGIRNEMYSILSSSASPAALTASAATATRTSEEEAPRRSSRLSADNEVVERSSTLPHQQPPQPQPQQPQPRRLTKKNPVLYHSLKKKQLQDLCRKEGLSTYGSDTELKLRHQAFLELYNAECDSQTPRTHEELLQDLAQREQQRRLVESQDRRNGAHAHTAHVERFFQQRNRDGPAMKRGDSEFDQEWKEGWKRLIAQGKEQLERERKKKQMATNEKKPANDLNEITHIKQASDSDKPVDFDTKALDKEEHSEVKAPEKEQIHVRDPVANRKKYADAVLNFRKVKAWPAYGYENQENEQEDRANEAAVPAVKPMPSVTPRVTKRPFEVMCPWSSATSVSDVSPPSLGVATSKIDFSSNQPKQPRLCDVPSKSHTSQGSIVGPWTCKLCTFLNTKRTWSTAKCEMCESPRPSFTETQEVIALN
ncbi:hypothetical protein FisN_8Hh374 [Fistulifera solaris]|jgi:hypothetical protein|uniref:RanBP-type and C3HC4-type zinc finger-containing protein 1 n=1 Tax=Fistulifera solaris TaxID=1519565 RepID=A0A1Z5K8A0_FISSO|nr:hypothetical protein FisN_8Hh374 [Fistulifera solaris]|eukprot:GAX22382.1 hypothetical protein FisN_8Hh374 [Fistulifera solaris]